MSESTQDAQASATVQGDGRGGAQPATSAAPAGALPVERPGANESGGAGQGAVSSLALDRLASGQVGRGAGGRAELAALRARLRAVRQAGDVDTERSLSTLLARRLVRQGARLGEAMKLARRSLLMVEDPALREELSSWFAGVGEWHLAAATLQPLLEREHDSGVRAALWMRIAVLSARAGDGNRAAMALRAAADADRSDPLPLELLGSLYRWASAVDEKNAAKAFYDASARHRARRDVRSATDALVQALDVAPDYMPAVEKLSEHLSSTGAFQAADELWRTAALHSPDGSGIHARRIRDALGANDVAAALAAALDQGADCGLDVDGIITAAELANDGAGSVAVPNFDGLLAPAGLTELLAARLTLTAESHEGGERARLFLALARLCAGPLGHPRRAAAALAEASLAAPLDTDVRNAVREYVLGSGQYEVEVEPLLRLCLKEQRERGKVSSELRGCYERLVELVGEDVAAPGIGAWALTCLERAQLASPELLSAPKRWRGQASSPATVWDDWTQPSLAELRRSLESLANEPARTGDYVAALREMKRRDPAAERWTVALERAFHRLGDSRSLEQLWLSELERPKGGHARARLGLARLYRDRHSAGKAIPYFPLPPTRLTSEEAALCCVLSSLHGDVFERAMGFERLAQGARSSVSAALLSVASGLALSDRDTATALRLAEAACHAGPSAARPVVAFVEAVEPSSSRVILLALERACEVVVPRPAWCRALSRFHPDQETALLWLRRWASLSPLDLESSRDLLERLISAGNTTQLVKGLNWLLGQPMPLARLVPEIIRALDYLVVKEPSAARSLTQRLIGVFGAKDGQVTAALSRAAEKLQEPLLRVAILERHFVAEGAEEASALLELIELRKGLGQVDAAYGACLRALQAGAEAQGVYSRMSQLAAPESSDGLLAQLEASILIHKATVRPDSDALAVAYRRLGAALWDLAGDFDAAIAAWEEASGLDEAGGDQGLARDLIAFCGYAKALTVLFDVAERRGAEAGAGLLTEAAKVAQVDGFSTEALQLGQRALQLCPTMTEVLPVLEQAASAEQTPLLRACYERALAALYGPYGERALCYRAAREFEQRREYEQALEYSIRAFKAVPAEGVTFAVMLRLGNLAHREGDVVDALRDAARVAASPTLEARWLARASTFLGEGPESRELRLSTLMRAVAVRPDAQVVAGVGRAIEELLVKAPEARAGIVEQFSRVASNVLKRLDAPSGLGVALQLAKTAGGSVAHAGLCHQALARAIEFGAASTADFTELFVVIDLLTLEREAADRLLLTLASTESPANGTALEFAIRLAERVESPLVASLRRQVEELALTSELTSAGPTSTNPPPKGGENAPLSVRQRSALERARALEEEDPERCAEILLDSLSSDGLSSEEVDEGSSILRRVLDRTQNSEALERLLKLVLERPGPTRDLKQEAARRLAGVLTRRGVHPAALDVLSLIDSFGGMTPSDLGLAVNIAREGGVIAREIEYSARLLELEPESDSLMRRLVELHEARGERSLAVGWAERLLQRGVADPVLFNLVIEHAEQNDRWPLVAELLQKQLEQEDSPSDGQIMRLADALCVRLNNPEQAAQVLGGLVEKAGASGMLIEKYAQCLQAAGQLAEASAAYQRASRLVREPRTAARLAELAARSVYPQTESLAELRVQVAARQQQPAAQAAALEELAFVSMAPAPQRARMLQEAAELSLRAGDPSLAVARAQRAARIAPTEATVQLAARYVEYRARGAGTSDEALTAIGELRTLGALSDHAQEELRVFLLAEALEQRVGKGAGLKELQEGEMRVGCRPLIALAILERGLKLEPSRQKQLVSIVRAGELRGVRTVQQLTDLLRRYDVEAVPRGTSLRPPTLEAAGVFRRSPARYSMPAATRSNRPARNRSVQPPPKPSIGPFVLPKPRSIRPGPPVGASRPPNPVVERQSQAPISRRETERVAPDARSRLAKTLETRHFSAPPERAVNVTVKKDPRSLADTWVTASEEPLSSAGESIPVAGPKLVGNTRIGIPSLLPDDRKGEAQPPQIGDERHDSLPAPENGISTSDLQAIAETPDDSVSALRPSRQSVSPPGSIDAALLQTVGKPAVEPRSRNSLLDSLRGGSISAGQRLMSELSAEVGQAHELVNVARLMVENSPGDLALLKELFEASLMDGDSVSAQAIEHILVAFTDPRQAPVAPPLDEQRIDSAMLMRLVLGAPNPSVEVITLLWQNAAHLFRDAQIPSGLTRINADGVSPLGRAFSIASRTLGVVRARLFRGETTGPLRHSIVLTDPVSVVLEGVLGDPTDSGTGYSLGSYLLGARPEFALFWGLPEQRMRMVLESVLAAFGPPRKLNGDVTQVALFAESLWESLPPSVQRRLQDLCEDPSQIGFDRLASAASAAAARAGLFLSGNARVAVEKACVAHGIACNLERSGELRRLCQESEVVTAILRFATSSAYAEARWRTGTAVQPGHGAR